MAEVNESLIDACRRMDREGARAHEAALVYFRMGACRSHAQVAERLQKQVRLMARWSKRWSWVERAAAYDEQVARQQQQEIEKEERAEAAKWARRAKEDRESNYHRKLKIERKVEMMLEFPLAAITTDGGRTIIKPAAWGFKDIASTLAAADKLKDSTILPRPERPPDDILEEDFHVVPYGGTKT